jgi:hypothetical protein
MLYFLGEEKANLVSHCLRKLHDVGVIIAGITCDGPSSNFAMFSNLGASILPSVFFTNLFEEKRFKDVSNCGRNIFRKLKHKNNYLKIGGVEYRYFAQP